MRSVKPSALRAATALGFGVLACGTAWADDQAADTSGTEIVVTARRIEERLQEVPISISVYNQKQLEERGVTTGADLAAVTPSLSINQEFGGAETAFSLRGFYQQIGTLPTVAVYFADAIEPRGGIGGQEEHGGEGAPPGSFFDLQNVQVLKGPQGTLFGRNTTGGAILLVPKKPSAQFEGYIDVEAGDYDMRRVQAVVNLPVNDRVRLRFGVDDQTRDGYMNNISGIGPSSFGNVDYLALRASAIVDITDEIENYTMFTYDRSKDNGPIEKITSCTPGLGAASITGPLACAQIARATGAGPYAVDNITPDPFNYSKQFQIINTTTWSINDDLTLKNIAQYAEWVQNTEDNIFGANFIPAPGFNFTLSNVNPAPNGDPFSQQDTITEELQLQGRALDGALQYTTGVYIESSQPLGNGSVLSSQLLPCTNIYAFQCNDVVGTALAKEFGLPPGTVTVGGVDPRTGEQSWHDYGVFGQATYAITDQLKATAGLRWSDDITNAHNTSVTYTFPHTVGTAPTGGSYPLYTFPAGTVATQCNQFPAVTVAGGCTVGFHNSSRAPTGLFDLEYAPVEDINTYAKYSRGYRAAGISPDGPVGEFNYNKETVDAYEVGVKTAFHGDVSGFVNIAGFYNNFNNQQLPEGFESLVGASSTIATLNAPKSTIDGFEIEGAIVPYKGLTLSFGYTYLNARLDVPPTTNINTGGLYSTSDLFVKGEPLPFTPRHKATLAFDYALPLDPDVGKVTFGMNYTYTAKQLVQASPTTPAAFTFIPESSLVNLNLSWENIYGSPIDAGFFMTNVFDRVILNQITDYVGQGLGWDSVGLNPPRMFGGRLKYKFGGAPAPTPASNPPVEAAPPPPPPAPVAAAPEPQRQFQVFFDFDKSDITSAASQVISAAADTVKSGHIATVNVTGHTDTVGTIKYNQALSERRAAAVKAALIADGVSGDEIAATGVGKSDLLVPTKDGVREPQNRRAVIQMQQAQS